MMMQSLYLQISVRIEFRQANRNPALLVRLQRLRSIDEVGYEKRIGNAQI